MARYCRVCFLSSPLCTLRPLRFNACLFFMTAQRSFVFRTDITCIRKQDYRIAMRNISLDYLTIFDTFLGGNIK